MTAARLAPLAALSHLPTQPLLPMTPDAQSTLTLHSGLQGLNNYTLRVSAHPFAGISCHFCRQKQVCTLPDCPRCSRRDAGQQCVGKSYCTRCRDPQGQLCAACLRVR